MGWSSASFASAVTLSNVPPIPTPIPTGGQGRPSAISMVSRTTSSILSLCDGRSITTLETFSAPAPLGRTVTVNRSPGLTSIGPASQLPYYLLNLPGEGIDNVRPQRDILCRFADAVSDCIKKQVSEGHVWRKCDVDNRDTGVLAERYTELFRLRGDFLLYYHILPVPPLPFSSGGFCYRSFTSGGRRMTPSCKAL